MRPSMPAKAGKSGGLEAVLAPSTPAGGALPRGSPEHPSTRAHESCPFPSSLHEDCRVAPPWRKLQTGSHLRHPDQGGLLRPSPSSPPHPPQPLPVTWLSEGPEQRRRQPCTTAHGEQTCTWSGSAGPRADVPHWRHTFRGQAGPSSCRSGLQQERPPLLT